MTQLAGWKPLYDAHAIEVVQVLVRFTQGVTDLPWRRIERSARAVAKELQLTSEMPIKNLDLTFVDGQERPSINDRDMGFQFLRLESPQFASDKLSIFRDGVSFESWRYTRWAGFAEKVSRAMAEVLNHYLGSVPIQDLMVQYIDRFNAMSEDSDCREVIQESSDYIARAAFHPTDQWHSRTGRFDAHDNVSRRLWNVDVDVADIALPEEAVRRTVRIRTSLSDRFNLGIASAFEEDQLNQELILQRLDYLHTGLKGILANVITREASMAISLGAAE